MWMAGKAIDGNCGLGLRGGFSLIAVVGTEVGAERREGLKHPPLLGLPAI